MKHNNSNAAILTVDMAEIAKKGDISELNKIIAQAEAIRKYLKDVNAEYEKQQKAAEIKLRAQFRVGQLLIEGRKNGTIAAHGGNRKSK